jgi:uncharacterized membrane protein
MTDSPPHLSSRFVVIAAVVAALGFAISFELVAFSVAHYYYVPFAHDLDVTLFQAYAATLLSGHVPYRDYTFLYPPGALPAFVIPAWLAGTAASADLYLIAFQTVMVAFGGTMAILVIALLSRVTDRRRDLVIATALLATAPVFLGWTAVLRYDLWPAMLTAATMLAVVLGRHRVAGLLLGLAILAKVYPVVLLPLLAIYAWRNAGRREAVFFVAITFGIIGAGFAPFLILGAQPFIDTMTKAFERYLQVESLGASVLFVLHAVNGMPIKVSFAGGSHNLVGVLPSHAIDLQTYALAVLLVILWFRFARGPADARTLLLAAAGSVALYVGLGRVLSDQYVIWLIPLVAMVPWGAARLAGPGLIAILALSNWIYPGEYAAFERDFLPGPAWVALARVVAILVLGLYLARRATVPRAETDAEET